MVPGALGSHILWGWGSTGVRATPTAPQASAREGGTGGGVRELWSPELQQRQNALFLNSIVN